MVLVFDGVVRSEADSTWEQAASMSCEEPKSEAHQDPIRVLAESCKRVLYSVRERASNNFP